MAAAGDTASEPAEANHASTGITAERPLREGNAPPRTPRNEEILISSDRPDQETQGYAFRGFKYATITGRLQEKGAAADVCLDSGCTMSLVDKGFLQRYAPDAKIQSMASPIVVRGIGPDQHPTSAYVKLSLYLPGKEGRTAVLRRKFHVVEALKANMLIGVDVIRPEGIVINGKLGIATIDSCPGMEIPISLSSCGDSRISAVVSTKKRTWIPPQTCVTVPITKRHLTDDRDFLFEPTFRHRGTTVFSHIIDCKMTSVFVRNETTQSIRLSQNTCLGKVVKYEADGCYHVHGDAAEQASLGRDEDAGQATQLRTVMAEVNRRDTEERERGDRKERTLQNGITVYARDEAHWRELTNTVMAFAPKL